MYCEPTYGGAPAQPLARRGLGALIPSYIGGKTTRQYTDGGVIVYPAGTGPAQPAPNLERTDTAPTAPLTEAFQFYADQFQEAEPPTAPEPIEQVYTSPEPQPFDFVPGVVTTMPAPVGGSGAPVNVSVTVPEGAQGLPQPEGKGFGIVEAGLGAALAFLLAQAWQKRKG